MICCRSRSITQDELIELLWSDEESSSNPVNALKTMFHRVRAMLDGLGQGVGHRLIIRRDGSYAWNPDVVFTLDIDDFEALCASGDRAQGNEERLDKYMRALSLYDGDFLPGSHRKPGSCPGAPGCTSFSYAPRSLRQTCWSVRIVRLKFRISARAVELEPYSEELHLHLMRALIAQERGREAVLAYRNLSELMYDNFGVTPSEEIRALYRQAQNSVNDREVSLGTVRAQLREPSDNFGALFCDYDLFKAIYHAQARGVARSGDAVHIGLLSVSGEGGGELSRQSLDVCMENLRRLICANLRRGDVAARCSVSQYVILLPQANYENSCMVCERVTKAFSRQYPHSPARLRFSVQPLEPIP